MRSILTLCSALLLAALASSSTFAQQKTVKACADEWRANKAENQAKGITERAFIAECRKGTAAAQPGAAAPPPATTAAPPANAPARPAPVARTPAPGQPLGANQFTSEAQAKAHCPAGTVVWANLKSKVYHFSGGRTYGHTKSGAYMCEQDAQSAGMRAAKNEKRPS